MSNIDSNPEVKIKNSIDKLQSTLYGLDYEKEIEDGDESSADLIKSGATSGEKPFDAEKIRVDQQMLSLNYIYELMCSKTLISPDFQRKHVWTDKKRKSLLIESIMLRIPIPAFYFFENEKGEFQIIDGQQRLMTIKEFMDGKFSLSGLEYLEDDFGGKYFSDLPQKYQQRINRTQLAVNVLDSRSPQKVIYDIFRRVNSGGVPLSSQEMRNAISSERIRDFLRKCRQSPDFVKATRNKISDTRMDSQELTLRFFAFYRKYDYTTQTVDYTYGALAPMLDNAMEELDLYSNETLDKYYRIFCIAMRRCYDLFGEYCFSRINLNSNNEPVKVDVINKSLFTSLSVILSDDAYADVNFAEYRDKAINILAENLRSSEYLNSITLGTGSKRRIITNFLYTKKVVDLCLGLKN